MAESKNRRLYIMVLLPFAVLVLVLALVVTVGPLFRYSYSENEVYGYTVRKDILTGEECLAAGDRHFARVLALPRCDRSG